MNSSLQAISGQSPEQDFKVTGRLEQARSRLEERFLEGGAVLAGALDSVSDMVKSLDQVTAALGNDTVDSTVADLSRTTEQLLELPALHATRQENMRKLTALGITLQTHVDEMLETLRYLRTFAVTVKITGAGASEFAGFADEMLGKIQSGRNQVDGFASRLAQLLEQVRAAVSFGQDLRKQYDGIVPGVTRDLAADAAKMGDYHTRVRTVAASLGELVRQVQGKVAKTLSALQIGDMTRQRVEHVQAGLGLLAGARADGPVDGEAAMLRLLGAQMEDLVDEFNDGCGTVTSSLAGLAGDIKEVLALGKQARGNTNGGDNFLRALETSVGVARKLVGRIEIAGQRTDEVSRSAATTARELSDAVDSIRTIKTEIQYMAINTSLRCSRMGEAGKPMNVVASELRVFANQMEVVSGRILEGLAALGAAASELGADDADATSGLGEALDNALANIREAGERMEADLKTMAAKGEHLGREVGSSVSRLDFTRELGEVLESCTLSLATEAAESVSGEAGDDISPAVLTLSEQLFKTYTMARERQVHRAYIPPQEEVAAEAATATANEDDDIEAALF
ncbi:chemotaxis protein [Mesorhizobium sp. CAU 1741]|uniref:chemotaxis protein n=1 Tax=Mesorhizobium sp. CAU 1741 TaxID=3140366 RepID=UPI00325B2DEE